MRLPAPSPINSMTSYPNSDLGVRPLPASDGVVPTPKSVISPNHDELFALSSKQRACRNCPDQACPYLLYGKLMGILSLFATIPPRPGGYRRRGRATGRVARVECSKNGQRGVICDFRFAICDLNSIQFNRKSKVANRQSPHFFHPFALKSA